MAEDWKQGRRQALEVATGIDSKNEFEIDTIQIDMNFRFKLGLILENGDKVPEEIIRPTDNELFFESMLKYPLGWTLDPYISTTVLTQITESFRISSGAPARTAKFRDPITTQESLGFAYTFKDNKNKLTSRLGFSLKQIRADKHTSQTDDRMTTEIKERYKAESGISFKTDARIFIDSSIYYTGRMDMFSSFDELEVWSIKFENRFDIKVWKFLGILFEFNLFYDERQSKKIQYNQNARLGIIAQI